MSALDPSPALACPAGALAQPAPEAPPDEAGEATVRARRPRRELTVVPVAREEVQRIPGSFGDALRAIQNLPGIARAPFLSGSLMERGSAPGDTLVLVDGTFLPAAYHFGGLGSTVATEMLDRLDFFPGNFSARYGRATGGVVDIGLRQPMREGARATMHLGVIDAGAFTEAALSPTVSVAASARFGWIGYLLSPIVAAVTGTATFVGYWDYQTQVDWRPTSRDRLRFAAYGSGDSVGVQQRNGGGNGGGNGFHLVQVSWWRRLSARTDLSVAVSTGWNGLSVEERPRPGGNAVGARVSLDSAPTLRCQTPCTLHLAPGEHALYTGSPAVLDAVSPLRVGDRAMAVVAQAPSRARWEGGRNLLVGGVGIAAVAGIFLAFSPLEVEGGSPTGEETIAVGATLGVASAVLIVLGLRAMGRERAGVAVTP